MAVALSSLWAGICTPFVHHTFLSLTIVLEALLGDRGPEITHKLAERAAALIGRTRAQRPLQYRVVKDLYDIRSRLVHGDAHVKKGTVTWDSFHISAKKAIVPVTKLAELGHVVNQVVHAVLSQRDLLAIIQKPQSEDKTSRELDDFFLRLTLT
jgi:hypothetical protein